MTDKELVISITTAIDASKLTQALDQINKKTDDAQKSLDKTGSSAKNAGTSFTGMATNVMKGVLAADIFKKGLSFLTDALMRNQKVADLVNTAMNAISIIMNDVVNVIVNVVEQVYKSSNGFQALGKVIMGVINIALTPLKVAFYGIKLVILELQKAWEESFFGDKDPKTIEELTKKIDITKAALVEVGEKAIQSGKDIVNNFGEAMKSVGDVVSGVADGISKIDVKADIAMAKRITGLQKNNDLLIAQAAGRAAEADRAAEKERQLRDDTNLSIKDREAANNRLLIHLDDQKKAMMDISNLEISKAKADIALNNNQENAVKLQDALNSKKEAAATMEGKYSEQKQNSVNLQKEEINLQKTWSDGQAKITIDDTKATNARIENTGKRLQAELDALKLSQADEKTRLQNNVNLFKEGTQARQDAQLVLNAYIKTSEQDIQNKKQEIRTYDIAQDKLAGDARIANQEAEGLKRLAGVKKDSYARVKIELDNDILLNNAKIQNLIDNKARIEQLYKDGKISQADYDKAMGDSDTQLAALKIKNEDDVLAKKKTNAEQINSLVDKGVKWATLGIDALSNLNDIWLISKTKGLEKGSAAEQKFAKQAFERNKKLQIAMAVISGIQGVVSAVTGAMTLGPIAGPIVGAIQGASIAIATAANIAKINATQFQSTSVSPDTSTPPSGNLPSAGNTIGLGEQKISLQRPEANFQKVYVTEGDIRRVSNKVDVIETRAKTP